MPKITLSFTDSEFAAFIGSNPQFVDVFKKRVEKPKSTPCKTKLDEACEFLRDVLSAGPMDYKDISELASLTGININAVKRARDVVGVYTVLKRKEGGGRQSTWRLPG